jgi:alanyl-tRNA synthetase
MLTASDIIQRYISFFEKNGHKKIANSPLVLQNDPTTLFTSSGMQPLVPYLLGETHPLGKRLVNVQNCFRAQDIDEIGDNRHTTFFRMLGNWSLGDYFKKEEIPWLFTFLTKDLGIDPQKLYITVFKGTKEVPKDDEAVAIWKETFASIGLGIEERLSYYDASKNWWSRSGTPDKMPAGEPGGPDTEVFYDFGSDLQIHETSPYSKQKCHVNCDCGRYIEICNSVFMQYKKQEDGSLTLLEKPNVDFGGGLERLLMASENQQDVFLTSLLFPIIQAIEKITGNIYIDYAKQMRIITDHFLAATMIAADGIKPSNKDQGYLLRRLVRRGFDNLQQLHTSIMEPVLEAIVQQYHTTDPKLTEKYEEIKNTILEETQKYEKTKTEAKKFIQKKYPSIISGQTKKIGDELMGVTEISADDAFILYTTHGLSPTQIKSLGYTFDDQAFAEKMKQHQSTSRSGATQKFKGGLADTAEKTVMGHTATHLLHQALRDVLGNHVHQTGSNITTERVRFDFNHDERLTDEQLKKVEIIVNEKIEENLPVHFEMIPTEEAKKMGAIGLFEDTYAQISKIYFIGGSSKNRSEAYSVEFCGGPHVDFTGRLKKFTIVKQENLGHGQKRLYATVGE